MHDPSFFRIHTIHLQLEDQLAVLAHFLDGVANLRPTGQHSSVVHGFLHVRQDVK